MTEEIIIDFDGTQVPETTFERILIPEDSYDVEVKTIETIEMPNYNDSTKKDKKLKINVQLKDGEEAGKELPHFLTPKIMKGRTSGKKAYSNSKLYDLLVDLDLKEKAQEIQDQIKTIDDLQLFLTQELVGKTVRAQIKTSKANTDDAYSVVGKILRFVD